MRLGIFMMPVHPPTRSFTETLAEDTEKSLLADRLGFEELWLGEHFSATSEPIPSPMMFMANLLGQTSLRFGTGVICIPNHDPIIVAAEAAQFDHMSQGRLMLGVGPGGLACDFELFKNHNPAARNRMVVEAIEIIKRIWSEDPPYDIKGEFWDVQLKDTIVPQMGLGYLPKPYQKNGPPISISVASPNSATARTAALHDWGLLTANIAPTYVVGTHWATYSEACRQLGKPISGSNWRVSRNLMVAPSDAEAEDRVFSEDSSNHYFFTYIHQALSRGGLLSMLKVRPDMQDEEVTPEGVAKDCVLYGSPTTVLDKLISFRDTVGPFESLLMTGLDWSGANKHWERQAMQLMAREVMPKFRQHVLTQRSSGG
jgi:alkanesulfonate monooxygenase SsuD/methylene tetrahydromethanopterin reductase-like flavin-dependent oxidoreductase (luciferase family)